MAKGKGKGGASAGPRKPHGPKRKLFHDWTSTMRMHLARAGLLSKYNNYESFALACGARGKRNPTKAEFNDFILLTREQKDEFFKGLHK